MYKAYVDGACRPNPGRGAYGFIICDDKGRVLKQEKGPAGENVTNNIAEYTAVIKAIRAAIAMDIDKLVVFSDSQIIIKQLNGEYQVYDPRLKQLHNEVLMLLEWFEKVVFVYINRQQNKLADALANEFYEGEAAGTGRE
jgi:ribonuclease HI